MHSLTLKTYLYALDNQGRYLLMLVGLSVFTLPLFNPALLFGMPLVLTLIGLALGLVMVKPAWQPEFLRNPHGFAKGLGAMLASSAIFLLAMMLGYVAVLNMGLEEPLSRNIAMLTALPSVVLTGLMWWTAAALIAQRKTDNTPPAPKVPALDRDVETPDLRALRKSRAI